MNEFGMLAREETARYARHLVLPEVGVGGQGKLKSASILVVGTGGLGSPVAMYLAAAGVGRIGIVDFDRVEYSNLQRQIIHGSDDVGRSKVESAAESIRNINPFVQVDKHDEAFTCENAMRIGADYDIIIDGTDNFATRYLVNDVCVLLGKPNCYGSIFRFEGQASVFSLDGGPCYRCLYPKPPDPGLIPNCAEGGVLGILPGMVGTIQATEAIKIILGIGESLSGRLLLLDALEMRFRQLTITRDPNCPVCGDQPTITAPIDYDQFCGTPKKDSAQSPWDIEPAELKRRLDAGEKMIVLDVREPHEYEICNLGGILIPLAELARRHGEIDRSLPIVVHCKMGGRSAKAVQLLRDAGFDNVSNLNGGINRWSNQIDASVPTY
ncbi:MAG: molybdopterin-synthase adenylyltransferase MoeB [Planctomycetales bacterium]|nr:molybdopterin-synthase adenylyltransferase MoeB [Planctomycetales bacterium]